MAEYIEREAVLELKYWDAFGGTKYGVVATDDIENIPAADVAPVVHGWWLHDAATGIAYCTECLMEAVEDGTDYCPNCGARMDGE